MFDSGMSWGRRRRDCAESVAVARQMTADVAAIAECVPFFVLHVAVVSLAVLFGYRRCGIGFLDDDVPQTVSCLACMCEMSMCDL